MPQTEATATPHPSVKLILVGEDDLDDQELFREIFSSVVNGLEFQFVDNGARVIEYLANCSAERLPSLILLDYNMPEMSGADILRLLKSNTRYREIPTVIWSTSGSHVYRKKCLEGGAADYIIKPSNVNELKEVATRILSLSR